MSNIIDGTFDPLTGGARVEAARAQMAQILAQFYGELAGTAAKPAPKFSLRRVFSEMAEHGGLDSGYEREVCGSAALLTGAEFDRNRVVVPWGAIGRRDATVAGSAGYLRGVANLGAVDVLREWSITARAGITIFDNLRENVTLPRVATAPTGAWLPTETTAAVDTTPVLGQVALTPHVYGVMIEFSTRFVLQAETAEEFLRTQLLRATARAIDRAFLNGAGGSEPNGLLSIAGIASESGTSFSHASACNIMETLATAGLDDANVVFVASPTAREILQQRVVATGQARFVWDNDKVANRPAYATNDMPGALMLAGDFSRAILGIWGAGPTLEINPYQDFSKGTLAARVLIAVDTACPQPGAFVKTTTCT